MEIAVVSQYWMSYHNSRNARAGAELGKNDADPRLRAHTDAPALASVHVSTPRI